MLRRIRLADHRGRDAIVLLVPRRQVTAQANGYVDSAGTAVRFTRRIKATEGTRFAALHQAYRDHEVLARALVDGDPEIDLDAVGRETGPCDRVFVGGDGGPLYAAEIVEVRLDPKGRESERRAPIDVPSNLVPDVPPAWSGRLVTRGEAARHFAFTRAYQVRHTNALEFDFLLGLARYLDERDSLVQVGSGPRGTGPLVPERNAAPLMGFLSGRVQGQAYRLVLHLAAFELRSPAIAQVQS